MQEMCYVHRYNILDTCGTESSLRIGASTEKVLRLPIIFALRVLIENKALNWINIVRGILLPYIPRIMAQYMTAGCKTTFFP